MKRIALTLVVGLALFIGGCATTEGTSGSGSGGAAQAGKEAPYGYRYFCNCGPDCGKCVSNSNMPGDCACGKSMVLKKVLVEDPANYYACGKSKPCEKLSDKNPTHCSHNDPLVTYPKNPKK